MEGWRGGWSRGRDGRRRSRDANACEGLGDEKRTVAVANGRNDREKPDQSGDENDKPAGSRRMERIRNWDTEPAGIRQVSDEMKRQPAKHSSQSGDQRSDKQFTE